MDEHAIHQWLIDCFGPIQGEMAWQQLSQLPQEVRDQLAQQDPQKLPKPDEVRAMMKAFTAGGLTSLAIRQRARRRQRTACRQRGEPVAGQCLCIRPRPGRNRSAHPRRLGQRHA